MSARERPTARFIRPGELLAMDPKYIHAGPQGFFWLFGGGIKPNERKGDVTLVHIRGELEHHEDEWGCSESYEGIVKRYSMATTGQDACEAHEREHQYDEGYKPIEAVPPVAIGVCIDSPGGVVSGLNETAKTLQKIRKACGIPTFVYVNEMAASAAYAIACAFGEIICPPSAVLGSIGVISTMISQAAKNKRDGYDVRLITSGARKADGHPHAPISDKAVEVETARVDKLALAFWTMAAKARGLSVDKVRSYEAGIFLGKEAKNRGLADAVMSFDDVLLAVSNGPSAKPTARPVGGVSDEVSIAPRSSEAVAMPIQLDALIKKTEAALAKAFEEKDSKKVISLSASLNAYKKTKKHVEHVETEEAPDDEDDDKDGEDKDDDGEDEKAAKSESDDEAKSKASEEEETDEKDEAKAALALVHSLTGMTGAKARGALQAIAMTAANTAKDVAELKKAQKGAEKAALIKEATGQYLTPKEATFLATQPMSTVQGFVEMRRKSGVIVNTDDTTLVRPKHVAAGTEESLPAETIAMIDAAVAHTPSGMDPKVYRATLVTNHLAAHHKQLTAAMNGVGRI